MSTNLFNIISGSKAWTIIGTVIAFLGLACTSGLVDIGAIFHADLHGFCAAVAAIGTFLAAVGAGLGDRRLAKADTKVDATAAKAGSVYSSPMPPTDRRGTA